MLGVWYFIIFFCNGSKYGICTVRYWSVKISVNKTRLLSPGQRNKGNFKQKPCEQTHISNFLKSCSFFSTCQPKHNNWKSKGKSVYFCAVKDFFAILTGTRWSGNHCTAAPSLPSRQRKNRPILIFVVSQVVRIFVATGRWTNDIFSVVILNPSTE